jgi:predicted MPP superfamily phosphohydrolase
MLAAAGVGAAAAAYAFLVEPRWLQRTHTRLHFQGLPPALEGLRVALLTDLHASRSTPTGLIRRAVDATLDARPDMIAITGDIAADGRSLERALDQLARLHAPLGVYIVPGNHDYKDVGIGKWRRAVTQRTQLSVVTTRARTVGGRAHGAEAHLCVAGVDDLAEGDPNLEMLQEGGPRDFTILLAHNPDQAEQARRGIDRVDLVLSGHTHGGQVRLPGVGALVNSAEHDDLYEAGVRRRAWTQVYTSRGVGTVRLRVRFLTRPEVAVLTLTGAPRPQYTRG